MGENCNSIAKNTRFHMSKKRTTTILNVLLRCAPKEISNQLTQRSVFLTHGDGEGSLTGVGVAVWEALQTPLVAFPLLHMTHVVVIPTRTSVGHPCQWRQWLLVILATWQNCWREACGSTSWTTRRLGRRFSVDLLQSCLETMMWTTHWKWKHPNASHHGLTELTMPMTLWIDCQEVVKKARNVTFNVVFGQRIVATVTQETFSLDRRQRQFGKDIRNCPTNWLLVLFARCPISLLCTNVRIPDNPIVSMLCFLKNKMQFSSIVNCVL